MGFYRTITIDHTQVGSSDTSSFPMAFFGTFSYLATVANGGKVTSSSGYDIAFVTDPSNGSATKLDFERVWWDPTTGACEFWVRIPTLSHTTDTVIYIYYGDATITTDQQSAAAVWDSNFGGVWHGGDGTTLSLADSTSHANNGTNHSATETTGQIGGAMNFSSAGGQYVDVGSDASINLTGPWTIEYWFKYTGSGTFQACVGNTGSGNGYLASSKWSGNQGLVDIQNGGTEGTLFSGALTYTNPDYFAVTFVPSTSLRTYINGNPSTSTVSGVGLCGTSGATLFGKIAAGFNWDGWLDEIRISKVERSADYFTATYNNTKTSSTFFAAGTETSGGSWSGASAFNAFCTMNNQVVQ